MSICKLFSCRPLGTAKVANDSHGRHVTALIVEF